jgi:putative transposase
MSRAERAECIDSDNDQLSVRQQCELLEVNRSTLYYEPVGPSDDTLDLLKSIDRIFTDTPFYGARRIQACLQEEGCSASRKRIRRLMKVLGLEAIYPRPRTSEPAPGHKIYPYLLRGLDINRPNQVWSADITYVPMRKGFVYVVAIIDWYSRLVLSWSLSNTMDADFCVETLKDALRYGTPEIFNTDQGSQFTSEDFVGTLLSNGIQVSMDGRGRWVDNVFVERLWRSLKYEEVYLHGYEHAQEARYSIGRWFDFYNTQRPHQALKYQKPIQVHNKGLLAQAASTGTTAPVLIMPSPERSDISNDVVALNVVSSNLAVDRQALPRK